MTLSCTVRQPDLAAALSQAGRAVGTDRAPVAVIKNVLLSVAESGDSLLVAATDLDQCVQAWVQTGLGSTGGAFTVPAKLFTDYVNALAPDTVTLTLNESVLEVRCGRSRARFKGVGAEEFPELPAAGTDGLVLPGDVLRAIGTRVAPHAEAAQGRPVLGAVCLAGATGTLRAQGMDGFHWADERYDWAGFDSAFQVLVPKAGLRLLAELCPAKTDVSLSLLPTPEDPRFVGLRAPALFVAIRLLEGVYPDAGRLRPEEFGTVVTVRRQALLGEVRRVLVLSGAERGLADFQRLRCEARADSLELSAGQAEVGTADGSVPAVLVGDSLRFVISAGYLEEMLAGLPGDEVSLSVNANSPAFLGDSSLPAYQGMIMPIADRWATEPAEDSGG